MDTIHSSSYNVFSIYMNPAALHSSVSSSKRSTGQQTGRRDSFMEATDTSFMRNQSFFHFVADRQFSLSAPECSPAGRPCSCQSCGHSSSPVHFACVSLVTRCWQLTKLENDHFSSTTRNKKDATKCCIRCEILSHTPVCWRFDDRRNAGGFARLFAHAQRCRP